MGALVLFLQLQALVFRVDEGRRFLSVQIYLSDRMVLPKTARPPRESHETILKLSLSPWELQVPGGPARNGLRETTRD